MVIWAEISSEKFRVFKRSATFVNGKSNNRQRLSYSHAIGIEVYSMESKLAFQDR
jgi:hypothetical protein